MSLKNPSSWKWKYFTQAGRDLQSRLCKHSILNPCLNQVSLSGWKEQYSINEIWNKFRLPKLAESHICFSQGQRPWKGNASTTIRSIHKCCYGWNCSIERNCQRRVPFFHYSIFPLSPFLIFFSPSHFLTLSVPIISVPIIPVPITYITLISYNYTDKATHQLYSTAAQGKISLDNSQALQS